MKKFIKEVRHLNSKEKAYNFKKYNKNIKRAYYNNKGNKVVKFIVKKDFDTLLNNNLKLKSIKKLNNIRRFFKNKKQANLGHTLTSGKLKIRRKYKKRNVKKIFSFKKDNKFYISKFINSSTNMYSFFIRKKLLVDNAQKTKTPELIDPYNTYLSLKSLIKILKSVYFFNKQILPSIILYLKNEESEFIRLHSFLARSKLLSYAKLYNDDKFINIKSDYNWIDPNLEEIKKLKNRRSFSRNQFLIFLSNINPSLAKNFFMKGLYLSYFIGQRFSSLISSHYFMYNNMESYSKLSFFFSFIKHFQSCFISFNSSLYLSSKNRRKLFFKQKFFFNKKIIKTSNDK